MTAVFADTNVLVYACDPAEQGKCRIAVDLLREAVHGQGLVLSTQVLQEFYVTVLRRQLLAPADALRALRAWSQNAAVVPAGAELLLQAAELQQRLRISYWDALVVQAALQSGCTTLFTEDLHHGLRVDGLEVVNPFLSAAHEDRAPYRVVSSPEAVDQLLREAIARCNRVSLVHAGQAFEGEPHAYGVLDGRLRLDFFQTPGSAVRSRVAAPDAPHGPDGSNVPNVSDAPDAGRWRLLDVTRITQLRLLTQRFAPGRAPGRGRRRRWERVDARARTWA